MIIQKIDPNSISFTNFEFITPLDVLVSDGVYGLYKDISLIGLALIKETVRKVEITKVEIISTQRGQRYAEYLISSIVQCTDKYIDVYCINKASLNTFVNVALQSHNVFKIMTYSQYARNLHISSNIELSTTWRQVL